MASTTATKLDALGRPVTWAGGYPAMKAVEVTGAGGDQVVVEVRKV